ncbi:phage tail protein [Pseudomonas fluorescens]|uniref:Phage tail protein n=2 Tax=Pseudomonas fluorescens TaxID=294 RepID=A0A327N5J5_PSEFL|nr:phage tail protein [Pseudomonas fluorescens]
MIPADARMISREWHQALLEGQSAGKVIGEDAEGHPVLADPSPPTPGQLAEQERYWRDGELRATDKMVTRHRDELEDDTATTLTAQQYTDLQAFRRALRNWPESGGFPSADRRPAAPQWWADQRQSFGRFSPAL